MWSDMDFGLQDLTNKHNWEVKTFVLLKVLWFNGNEYIDLETSNERKNYPHWRRRRDGNITSDHEYELSRMITDIQRNSTVEAHPTIFNATLPEAQRTAILYFWNTLPPWFASIDWIPGKATVPNTNRPATPEAAIENWNFFGYDEEQNRFRVSRALPGRLPGTQPATELLHSWFPDRDPPTEYTYFKRFHSPANAVPGFPECIFAFTVSIYLKKRWSRDWDMIQTINARARDRDQQPLPPAIMRTLRNYYVPSRRQGEYPDPRDRRFN